MTKIAETYIHLKLDATDELRIKVKDFLYRRGNALAKEVFPADVTVSATVEDGSIKARLTVMGVIYLIFSGISNYGSFRSGIDHIVKDAKRFSHYVISDFVKETAVSHDKVIRLEKRLGVPGMIQRLFKRIDRLKEPIAVGQKITMGKMVIDQTVTLDLDQELEGIKKEITRILELIDHDKDRQLFISSLPESIKTKLPKDISDYRPRIQNQQTIRKNDAIHRDLPEINRLPPRE